LKAVGAGNSGGVVVQCEKELADGGAGSTVGICYCVVEFRQVNEDGDGCGTVEGRVNGEGMHLEDVGYELDVEPGFVDVHAGAGGTCQSDAEFQAIVAGGFVSEYLLILHRE